MAEIETPIGDFFNSDGIREMERNNSLLFEDRGNIAMLAHKERPYNGQPQTDHGERGKTVVKELTMRDIADCMARGFAQGTVEGEDDFDWEAVIQNAMVNVEKMMGIWPNVPGYTKEQKQKSWKEDCELDIYRANNPEG